MAPAASRLPALLCLLLGLLGALPLVVLTPPLQVPDEAQHLARAYQLSELRMWSRAENGKIGDDLPTSLADFTTRFLGSTQEHVLVRAVPRQPLVETMAERARPLAPEVRSFLGFQGAAFYAPLAYIPQALAMRLARVADAGPLMLLYAGRFANVFAAVALLVSAVLIAPVGKEMLVVVGLLPMALYQDASLSPDAVMLGCAFLYTAIALRAQWRGRWRVGEIVAAIVAGTTLCSLKPVYAPLLLVGLVPDVFSKDRRAHALGVHLLIVASVAFITWLWMRSTAAILLPPHPGISVAAQMAFVLAHPLAYAGILASTLQAKAAFYYDSAIGMFGWLTVPPPPILLVLPVVAAAAVLAWRDDEVPRNPRAAALWQLALALACVALVMTSLYLIWTPVGDAVIRGVQGRYFLPVLGAAAIASCGLCPALPRSPGRGAAPLMAILACIGVAQVIVSDVTIVEAYAVLEPPTASTASASLP